jgi:hypothetical protein
MKPEIKTLSPDTKILWLNVTFILLMALAALTAICAGAMIFILIGTSPCMK